jgi:hypothetical protein
VVHVQDREVFLMSFSMVTLRDGSQVQQDLLFATTENLQRINKESYTAFFALVKKCKDTEFVINDTPKEKLNTRLKKYKLIDKEGNVPEAVKRIVMNSFKVVNQTIKLSNPVKVYRL